MKKDSSFAVETLVGLRSHGDAVCLRCTVFEGSPRLRDDDDDATVFAFTCRSVQDGVPLWSTALSSAGS